MLVPRNSSEKVPTVQKEGTHGLLVCKGSLGHGTETSDIDSFFEFRRMMSPANNNARG